MLHCHASTNLSETIDLCAHWSPAPVHLRDRQWSSQRPLRPRGHVAKRRSGSQGTQLPSQPIARATTKQPVAPPSRSSLLTDELTRSGVYLWRCAVSHGHRGVMLWLCRLSDDSNNYHAVPHRSITRSPSRPRWGRCLGRPGNRWLAQLRRDKGTPPAVLWRRALTRRHSRATLRSSSTMRYRRRRRHVM